MEHLQSLQKIFTGRILRIPDYQRGYAWEDTQRKDLLDDLEDLDVLGPNAEHYTGTLVLNRCERRDITDEDGQVLSTWDVVDGQQRLITLIILLASIRRVLGNDRQVLAEGIRKRYLFTKGIHEVKECARLILAEDTARDFFERSVLGDQPGQAPPAMASEGRLLRAREQFHTYLATQAQRRSTEFNPWLLRLYTKITSALLLTVYEVKHDAEVGIIFETMNNRGRSLSEMEKVKNYLLFLASRYPEGRRLALSQEINRRWRNILNRLSRFHASRPSDEDQLLRAHFLMAYQPDARKWDGVNSVKEILSLRKLRDPPADKADEARTKLAERLVAYITSLDDFSVVFCDHRSPTNDSAFSNLGRESSKARHLASKLQRMDALSSFLPCLGALRLRHTEVGVLLSFLDLFERYAFRVYRFAERRANAGQSALYRIGYQIYKGKLAPEAALDEVRALLLHYAPEAEFRRCLREDRGDTYDWYNWYGLKYFLYEYEEHLATQANGSVALRWGTYSREVSIEHILPQTATSRDWTSRFSKVARAWATNDLGNLCLTPNNSTYSNKSYSDKLGKSGQGKCYANGDLFMERDLANYPDWTEEALNQRRQRLAEWAEKRWAVAPASVAPPTQDDDDEVAHLDA